MEIIKSISNYMFLLYKQDMLNVLLVVRVNISVTKISDFELKQAIIALKQEQKLHFFKA